MDASAAGSGGSGASSVEVYGFVGWITSAVGFVIFLVWAFLPEEYLHSLGVSYYPSKQWALTIPLWLILCVLYIYWVYETMNMMTVHKLSSLYTIHDEKCKWIETVGMESVVQSTGDSIPPLVHIPAPIVCRVLYGKQSAQEAEAEERTWQHHLGSQPPTIRRRAGSRYSSRHASLSGINFPGLHDPMMPPAPPTPAALASALAAAAGAPPAAARRRALAKSNMQPPSEAASNQ